MANTAKTAIITGASRGIGVGLVEAFLKRGYSVVANSRNISKANPFAVSANLALVDGDIGDPRTARHTPQRSALYCGSWSTTSSAGACKTWFEECEGHCQDYLFRGGAKRTTGPNAGIPATTESNTLPTQPQSIDFLARDPSRCL
jgi:NAD(P)-dependent dehydrogenase (short-subunit alcohol dehydrogenase family)